VAITPDGTEVYVTNTEGDTVWVIDTATNQITTTVSVGSSPAWIAITPNGTQAYVANEGSNTVSVIDTATNQVTATISVGEDPCAMAITPDGTEVYVTNNGGDTVSVIDTATNQVTVTISTRLSCPLVVALATIQTNDTVVETSLTAAILTSTSSSVVRTTIAGTTTSLTSGSIVGATSLTSGTIGQTSYSNGYVVSTATRETVSMAVMTGVAFIAFFIVGDATKGQSSSSESKDERRSRREGSSGKCSESDWDCRLYSRFHSVIVKETNSC
jgi:YVTN family beta-propeller protein